MKEIEYLNTLNEFVSENQKDLSKKQTAIEWLVEQIEIQNKNGYEFHPKYNQHIFEQAKEMHKQEHSKTWDTALDKYEVRAGNYMRAYEDFDEYYDEQFKK